MPSPFWRLRRLPSGVWWALAVAALLIFLDTVGWWSVHDPFTGMAVGFFTFAVFVIGLVWSATYAFLFRREGPKSWLPLGIIGATALALWFTPVQSLVVRSSFALHGRARAEVVQLVEAGKLKADTPDRRGLVRLPPSSQSLSPADGMLDVNRSQGRTTVLFHSFEGLLSHEAGFMYRSDDSRPNASRFEVNYAEVERMRRHWFWVSR